MARSRVRRGDESSDPTGKIVAVGAGAKMTANPGMTGGKVKVSKGSSHKS